MDHGFGDVETPLVIAYQPPPADHPAEGPFDDPPTRDHLEPDLLVGPQPAGTLLFAAARYQDVLNSNEMSNALVLSNTPARRVSNISATSWLFPRAYSAFSVALQAGPRSPRQTARQPPRMPRAVSVAASWSEKVAQRLAPGATMGSTSAVTVGRRLGTVLGWLDGRGRGRGQPPTGPFLAAGSVGFTQASSKRSQNEAQADQEVCEVSSHTASIF